MRFQYDDNCKSQTKICEVVEKLRGGRTNVIIDDSRSGWSSTVTYDEVKLHIDQRVRDNRRIRTDETASKMSNSHGAKKA
jgi:hypothetical protein